MTAYRQKFFTSKVPPGFSKTTICVQLKTNFKGFIDFPDIFCDFHKSIACYRQSFEARNENSCLNESAGVQKHFLPNASLFSLCLHFQGEHFNSIHQKVMHSIHSHHHFPSQLAPSRSLASVIELDLFTV